MHERRRFLGELPTLLCGSYKETWAFPSEGKSKLRLPTSLKFRPLLVQRSKTYRSTKRQTTLTVLFGTRKSNAVSSDPGEISGAQATGPTSNRSHRKPTTLLKNRSHRQPSPQPTGPTGNRSHMCICVYTYLCVYVYVQLCIYV